MFDCAAGNHHVAAGYAGRGTRYQDLRAFDVRAFQWLCIESCCSPVRRNRHTRGDEKCRPRCYLAHRQGNMRLIIGERGNGFYGLMNPAWRPCDGIYRH